MTQRQVSVTVRALVTFKVIAEERDGEVNIVSVVGTSGLPSPRELIESMDSDDLDALDAAYEQA